MIFDKEITVPGDFAVAFHTGRSSLLNNISRPLNSKETEKVAQSIGVMLNQLQRQQEEIVVLKDRLLELVKFVRENARSLAVTTDSLYNKCNEVFLIDNVKV